MTRSMQYFLAFATGAVVAETVHRAVSEHPGGMRGMLIDLTESQALALKQNVDVAMLAMSETVGKRIQQEISSFVSPEPYRKRNPTVSKTRNKTVRVSGDDDDVIEVTYTYDDDEDDNE